MAKKKRQNESNSDDQGPLPKKQALSSSGGRYPDRLFTHESSEPNGSNLLSSKGKVNGANANHTDSQNIHDDDENIQGKSGYESLDLLEETLMNPSNIYVPSSLPSSQPLPQKENGSNGEDHQDALPPLPKIQNPQLAKAPFKHQGTQRAAEVSHQGSLLMNYERLEFLGDAYLELLASRYILPRFPRFDPGKLSQTRQLLVCNETLANFSERYGFDEQARLPAEIQRKKGTQDKVWIKAMGDIFEAYIAALIISDPENGYSTAEQWLAQLWEPLLRRQVNSKVVHPLAKQKLSTKIMTKGGKIHYRDDGSPEPSDTIKGRNTFFMKVYYTGLGYTDFYLGSGSGSNKTDAGQDAATNALRHPRLGDIIAKKKKFDRQPKPKAPS